VVSQALISLDGLKLYIIERSRTLFTLYFYLMNKDIQLLRAYQRNDCLHMTDT
jgi:hypothetical protein